MAATRPRTRKPVTRQAVTYEEVFAPAPTPPPQPQPPQFIRSAPDDSTSEKVNKSQIIREFIEQVGYENATSRNLNTWLTRYHPGVFFTPTALRTSLSLERKKHAKKTGVVKPALQPDASVTYESMVKIKKLAGDMCRELGLADISAAKDCIEKLYRLSQEVGSFDNLRKSLAALCELRA